MPIHQMSKMADWLLYAARASITRPPATERVTGGRSREQAESRRAGPSEADGGWTSTHPAPGAGIAHRGRLEAGYRLRRRKMATRPLLWGYGIQSSGPYRNGSITYSRPIITPERQPGKSSLRPSEEALCDSATLRELE
jgi:hypothetical protein